MSERSDQRRPLDDDRLDEVLASVGQHLVVDAAETADVVVPPRRWSARPLLAAALVVAVIAAAVVAIAPARRTVGGWLRGGPVDVRLDPERRRPSSASSPPTPSSPGPRTTWRSAWSRPARSRS